MPKYLRNIFPEEGASFAFRPGRPLNMKFKFGRYLNGLNNWRRSLRNRPFANLDVSDKQKLVRVSEMLLREANPMNQGNSQDIEAIFIEGKIFRKLLEENKEVRRFILQYLCQKLDDVSTSFE